VEIIPDQPRRLDKEQKTALVRLRWHWDESYAVNCDGDTWTAIPVAEPLAVLTASTAAELRTAMQNDYAERASASRASCWPAGNSGP
jgi:hypothetical protein